MRKANKDHEFLYNRWEPILHKQDIDYFRSTEKKDLIVTTSINVIRTHIDIKGHGCFPKINFIKVNRPCFQSHILVTNYTN